MGLFLLSGKTIHGQVLQFSQPWAFPSFLNPAFTATAEQGGVQMGYMQFAIGGWNNYAAYYAAGDYYVEALQGGIGLSVIGEKEAEGVLQTYQAGVSYSFQFHLSRKVTASLGIQAQLLTRQYNAAAFVFEDMLRGTSPSGTTMEVVENKVRYAPDFSVGGVISWPRFFVGLSARHLTEPTMGIVNAPWSRQIGLQMGYDLGLYEANGLQYASVIPNVVMTYQAEGMEFRPGVYYQNHTWLLGGWLRIQQPSGSMGGIVMAGYQWGDYRFAYSYASHVDKLSEKNINSTVHQVTFLMDLQYKQGGKKVRAIKCPKI